jgi:hypothetical protein
MSNEDRKARLKQRCMDDVASKRARLIRNLRNAPDSIADVGQAIVESMQSEDPGIDPDDPHAGLTEAEYQELMASLEDALLVRIHTSHITHCKSLMLRTRLPSALYVRADTLWSSPVAGACRGGRTLSQRR